MTTRPRRWPIYLAALLAAAGSHIASAADLPVHDGVGGSFSAPSSLGRELSSLDLRGNPFLLFFGYTACPDACPATLAHLQALMAQLGPAADRVRVLLVTVDPENDTAEHLRKYLARFDSRFIGLTGTQEQVDRIARLFRVEYHRSHGTEVSTEYNPTPASSGKSFLYVHSQQVYLIDALGRTRALFFAGSPLNEMRDAIQILLGEAERGSAECVPPTGDREDPPIKGPADEPTKEEP